MVLLIGSGTGCGIYAKLANEAARNNCAPGFLIEVGSSRANTNNVPFTFRWMLKKAQEWNLISAVPVIKLVEVWPGTIHRSLKEEVQEREHLVALPGIEPGV